MVRLDRAGEGSAERARPRGHAPRRVHLLGHAALIVLTAWLAQTLVLELGNTLHHNGRWRSTKVDLQYGILGAVSFLTTRTALFRNRLDLGVWHGYHEILYRDPVELESVAFRFRLARPGYLVLLFNHTPEDLAGVRLSRSEGLASACVSATPQGEFLSKRPLELGPLDDAWHDVALVAREGHYALFLDGRAAGRCGAPRAGLARVGFRGSAAKRTYLDDVVIRTRDGTEIREDFSNRHGRREALVAALLAVLVIHAAVLLATRRSRARTEVSASLYLATTHAVLLAVLGLALATDRLYLWKLHPKQVEFEGYQNRIEYTQGVTQRLRRTYPPGPAPDGVRRILFIGSSQTWGSGAATPDQPWVTRLERRLDAEAGGPGFQFINTAIPGTNAAMLLEHYRDEWIDWRPEAVVINLGNNDRDPDELAGQLERFVAINRAHGIHTVFIPEPNTIENRRTLHRLEAKHEAMRRVGRELGAPVIELHPYLVDHRDDGFVWWDRVHLTPFGHELFARRVWAERAKILEGSPP